MSKRLICYDYIQLTSKQREEARTHLINRLTLVFGPEFVRKEEPIYRSIFDSAWNGAIAALYCAGHLPSDPPEPSDAEAA